MSDTVLDHPQLTADELPPVLSPAQLAAVMGVSRKTVYLWNVAATGPAAMRIGKHVRYRREDVEAWLAQHAGAAVA